MTNLSITPIEQESTLLPPLSVIDGRVMVTSLKVAEDFKKSHRNVLRDVQIIAESCPIEFGRLNFELSTYTNDQNKTLPLFNLTRDGFALLAMGFNGGKALAFKLA